MSETNEPSMYQPRSSDDWPVAAIPKRWVESLFAKMSAYYGARFSDLWRGSDALEVQKAWGLELAKITSQQLKAGVDALSAFVRPPTLPEFVQHCRQMRQQAAASDAPQLPNEPRTSPEEAAKGLAAVQQAMRALHWRPTAEWAFIAYQDGKPRSYEAKRCITDAITSPAGALAVAECVVPALKAEYARIRQAVVDDYRTRGIPLWGTQ